MLNDQSSDSEPSSQHLTLWDFVHRNPMSTSLILISIAIAFWTQLGSSINRVGWLTFVTISDSVVSQGYLPGLVDGQLWRIITPIFIHFGIIHLVFNMMWLYDLGGIIETKWSSIRLLILVAIIGSISNAAQFVINGDFTHGIQYANALSGGMSGVVYGLFGYIWIRSIREPSLGLHLNRQTVIMMLGWLVYCMTGLMGYIGNTAHAVGLLVGIGAGLIAARDPHRAVETQ